LTVIVVAEQFRSDYLFRNVNAFSAKGFRRLMEEGAFFPDCRLLSTSFTLSGLATIATGSYPSIHGIVADRWYEPAGRRAHSAAAADLAAPTLFQQESDPANRIVSIAGDVHKARFFQPDASKGLYPLPDDRFQNRAWIAHGAPAGTVALRTLTYDPAKPENFRALFGSSPFSQSAEMKYLRETIAGQNLGTNSFDTVVAVLDSIGKLGLETGAVSPLIDDEVRCLDADISSLLEWLDARGESYQFLFTAAHGAPVEPPAGSRIRPEEIVASVENALAAEFGKGNASYRFVEAYVYPFLYLRTEHLTPGELPRARRIAGNAAVAGGRVSTFVTADGYCPTFGEWETRARNSLYGARSGDVLLAYNPGFVEYVGADRGVSYGSLWNYDTQVPLLLKGPSFVAGRFDRPVELTDIAPTLAAIAGLPAPAAATGRVLTEAFGEL
jgi:hypothetical protein